MEEANEDVVFICEEHDVEYFEGDECSDCEPDTWGQFRDYWAGN